MAQAKEMLEELKDNAPEADPFPTIRESLAELGANPDKYEKILAKTDDKFHWEKVFQPKTTLEVGAITLLAAAKQSGAEPQEYLSRLAPYYESRIQSLPDLYNVSGYVREDAPKRAVLTRTAREEKGAASTLPHELEHTLQGFDPNNFPRVKVPGRPDTLVRFAIADSFKNDLQKRLSELPEEERKLITAEHPVFGRYLSRGDELFARIRAKEMLDSAKGEDFLQTEMGQKLFPTDRDRAYFVGSTLPGVPTITPPYDFESTEKNRKPLTDPKTSYARQLYNKLTAPKEYQEGGEVEMPEEQASPVTEAAKQMLFYKKTAAPRAAPDMGQADGIYQEPTVASETARIFGMKPRDDRYNILPRYVPGEGLVAPEMLYDAARAVASSNVARQGYTVAPEDAVNMAFNVMGGSLGVSTAMKKPTGEGGKVVASSVLPSSTTAKDDLSKMPKPSKVLAPANESGFYSPTEAAALNLQRKSGAGQAFLNDIMKGENVRADEIKTMGLDTFLKDKKNVTADEVRDYIAQNKIQLGESVYGYRKPPEAKPESPEDFLRFENLGEEIDSARNFEAETKAPKFESYALPGGENYREIVLTLPFKEPKMPKGYSIEKMDYDDGTSVYFAETPTIRSQAFKTEAEAKAELQRMTEGLQEFRKDLTAYKSSHWDEANPLAHLRVSDRVTDGKKTLLVDEVQSDWHQAGRERGYASQVGKKVSDEEHKIALNLQQRQRNGDALSDTEQSQLTDILDRHMASLPGMRVPDAPYKDDWYQLTLRRAIKEAIDGGYDRVALPTGSRVADRFDLSKQIESISHQKNPNGTYQIVATDKNNRHVLNETSISAEKLSSIVGKDIAKKIIGEEGTPFPEQSVGAGMKKLSGLDLQIGGEGMKKYYDEIYPGYLKKFGKKYGAESGMTSLDTNQPMQIFDLNKPEPLFYMDITPKMREEFSTGIPMKDGGEVLKGGIGSIPKK